MKSIVLVLLFLSIFIGKSSAQNLVPNPGFEEYDECPSDLVTDYKTPLAKYWQTPTKGTADYYNACSRFNVGIPNNIMGNAFAYRGNGYIGLILLEKPERLKLKRTKPYNYREYVQCNLKEPLIQDSLYEIKFMYCVAEYSNFYINRLGAYLSEKRVKANHRGTLELNPTIACDTIISEMISGTWYEVADTIIASGNEQYLTIGNFYIDSDTKYYILDHSIVPNSRLERIYQDAFAYYYIDNVSVRPICIQ